MKQPREILGPYELLRRIDAGGMAEVFHARLRTPSGFSREVALKRLFPHVADDRELLSLFQLESQVLASVNHPGVPQVFDFGSQDGTWFIAMEYVEGLTAAELWRAGASKGDPMPMPVSVAIALQVCEALHHVHERFAQGRHLAIVHRDVTPQNILVNGDGVTKLIDFGVAQWADTALPPRVRGTFAYMAPEQARGEPVDRRADIFAIGVMLYELTTGLRLFGGGSQVDTLNAVAE
ncbi:MAG: serine/threonine protein kinase, partial [Myxococcales bacterium]|nr:serine/threonine protein kinase [Myxococcales bacterium]